MLQHLTEPSCGLWPLPILKPPNIQSHHKNPSTPP
ncbi:MAG: hypothetical protein ACI9CQ_002029, partial [Saprospiraceae bacterium]